jgi:PKD domain
MRVPTRAWLVALALCAVWPATAAANVDGIAVQPGAGGLPFPDFVCIGASTTAPLQLSLTTAQGATLQTITLPTADDVLDTGCPTTSAHTFEPGALLSTGLTQPAFNRYPGGARLTATQNGTSVTFSLPYGAFSGGTTRLRSLPNPSDLTGGVVANAVAGTYDGPAAVAGTAVTATGSARDSAGATVPLTETITPAQYTVSLADQTVTVTGADPLGPAVGATLSGPGGTVTGRAALRARVGVDCSSGCTSTGSFDVPPASGGTIAVAGQAGWFPGRTVALPSGSLRLDGFDVSVPAGYTGSYDYNLRFFNLDSIPQQAPSSALRCLELGAPVTCPGASAASRLSVSAGGLFVAPGDTVDVTSNDASGDSATITATAGGLSGSLDDGSLVVRGAPRAQLVATLSSPQTPPRVPFTASYTDRTDETGTDTLVDAFPVHIQNGAVVTISGPATGPIAQRFAWNLSVGVDSADVVRGSTYPGGRIAIDHVQGGHTEHFDATADATGAFAVPLGDAQVGDIVNVAGADPSSHQMTTTTIGLGGPTVKITGVTDGQVVRGTITPTVTGTGLDSVFWNGNEATLPTLLATTAPFPYPLDTTKWDDGSYRLEAAGHPDPGGTDYLYLTIDNTPPNGGAGNDQTVAKGAQVNIVTGASDDTSGIASVKVDFGDTHRQTISGAKFADPITHTYAKLGTFTVLVTITDEAGNVTSDTARIRVASTITPQVSGKFAGKLVHKKLIAAKLTSHAIGQLEIAVLSETGVRKLTKRVTFTKSSQHINVTLLTRGLKVGRYVVVEQFTDTNGVAGPVQAQALRVVKPVVKKK